MNLLESVAVNARDAILITESFPIDPPGPRIIYCNASFTRMTGHTEAEVLGQTPRIFQGADTDRATLDRLRTALERSEGVELELLNYTKAGASFWVELSIVPVWNQGQLTHWVSIQRDISERKTAGETAIRARIAEARNQALAAEIEERKRVEAQLAYTAFYDDLTKLHNRAFLMDRLRSMLVQVRIRRPFGFALLFADLDRFKIVNDSLGHQVGDELLRAVASRLQACIRPQDTMARVGGDEFAILIDDADTEVALQIAERILETLKTPLQLKDHQMFSSCSIGIVEASGRVLEAEDLLRDADIAMYQVKKAGGRGYAVFTESMHAAALTTLELQTEVRLALERGELRVHYQALMRTGDAGVAGFEALVRWEHPQRGLVLPSLFIPAAEEIGLVRQIGRWVLRHACEQLRAWHLRYPDQELRLSVNVSGSELQDDLFVDHLRQVLDTTGVAARSLELEITESVLLAQPEAVAGLLEQIREFGVRIALDDFGTGYSSLSYLDRYPLDTIKVDRSFVSALPVQKRTVAIVETIVRLGHALDLEVVAEGVETADQLGAVVSLGCDYVQGFYYSRPLPAAEAEVLLDKAQTKR